MTTKRSPKAKRPVAQAINEASAKAAFEALRPMLEAIPREQILSSRVDVQIAAAIAHSIAVRDAAEPRRA